MTIGHVFWFLALLLFFCDGIGATFVPRAVTWGLFCLTLGLLTGGVALPLWRVP